MAFIHIKLRHLIRSLSSPRSAGRLVLLIAMLLCLGGVLRAQHDLSMFRLVSDSYVQRGQIVTMTFVVTNDRGTDVDGVTVQLDIPSGLRYRRHYQSPNFDPLSGIWDVGRIRFFQPQRIISIEFDVVGEGVQIVTAEIASMSGTDSDSTPGNGVLDEDDLVSACVTVPIRAECGQSVKLTAPAGYAGYSWYRNGIEIPGATSATLNVGETGFYNFQIAGVTTACVLGSCCPAEVSFDSISVALSQNSLCTGGFDTVQISMPEVDQLNFTQVYTWASLDDPTLRFLSCFSCAEPRVVINAPYAGDTLRYQVSVVTRDLAGNVVCSAGATISIAVRQAPQLAFNAPTYVCAETCQDISVTPDLPISSIAWAGPNLRTPNGLVMQYCPRATTGYRYERFVVTAVGIDGCIREDSFSIGIMPAFAVSATGDARQCQDLPIDLVATLTPVQPADSVRYTWTELPTNPNSGSNLLVNNLASVTTDSLSPGSYGFSVSVTRMAPDGTWVCTYQATHQLEVEADCAQPRLGGFAWKDGNVDGIRQNYEAPLAGVQAQLFRSDGTPTGLTTTSDATGFYEFGNLAIGTYYVQFQPLPNFVFAPQNVGNDEFVDSDADPTGRSDDFAATYDEAVHVVGVGYAPDCQLAYTNVRTTPSDCGNSAGSLTFDVYGGSGDFTYAWQPDLSQTNAATGLPAGQYLITTTDIVTGCVLRETLTVPGQTNFKLTVSSSPAACPMGKGGSITLFTDGGITPFRVEYLGPDAGVRTANAMPYTIQDVHAGDFVVAVTDAAGCRQQVSVEVTENPLLLTLDTLNVVRPSCGGGTDGSFEVAVSGFFNVYTLRVNGQTITANSNQSTVRVLGQSGGDMLIEATDANGCLQRFTFRLRDRGPVINLADLVLTNPRCVAEASGSILSSSGKNYEVRDMRGNRLGNLPLANLRAGSYTIVDRSTQACTITATVELEDPIDWSIQLSIVSADCGLDNGSIRVVNSGGRNPYTYTWTPALSGTPVQNQLAAGNYRLNIVDSAGCSLDTLLVVPSLCAPVFCADFFTADTVVVETTADHIDWCMANFSQPTLQQFTIDGVSVAPSTCNRNELISYNLASLAGDGRAGPYLIEFWFGGDDVVLGEVVDDGEQIAAALNRADGWGRWKFDTTSNFVTGGQPFRRYGEIEITQISSGNTFYLTPEQVRNQLSGSISLVNGRSSKVRAVNSSNGCVDSVVVIVRQPDACRTVFQPRSTTTATPYCDQPTTVCIDVPFALLADHQLTINGSAYSGVAEPCSLDDVIYYDLSGLDLSGTFKLQAWIVDGRGYNARVADVDELAARMSYFDNLNWRFDAVQQVMRGGNTSRVYRDLVLQIGGSTVRLQPQRRLYDGTRIELLPGVAQAALTGPTACAKTFSVSVRCSSQGVPQRDTIYLSVGKGFADTLCLSTAELSAQLELVANYCPQNQGVFAKAEQLDSTCFAISGLEIGQDTLCIRVCDINGVCDTTIVVIDVQDPQRLLYPLAVDDYDSLIVNGITLIDVLRNDDPRGALTSFEIVQYARYGRARRDGEDISYVVQPDYCGQDSLIYEICNGVGCDRATVYIKTICGGIIIYSGFSPNYDDVNETFTVVGVEQFPDNRMEVYNRYGNLVFEMDSYDNSWRGTSFEGDELPEGTYFYVFNDGKGKQYTGYVYIKR